MIHPQGKMRYIAFFIGATCAPAVWAQSAADADSDIEIIEVTGQETGRASLNPGAGTIESIFGAGLALKDTPRAATVLSAEALQQYNINSLHDIARVAPNTYAASGFGTPSLPSVRGQLGELFQDGIRRQAGNNGFGLPFSFNSVGQLAVVKGPPTVLLGSTQRNGGFVNVTSKRASVTQRRGLASISGGRWDDYVAQLDYTTPLSNTTGVRVSARYQDADDFYDFGQSQHENVFVTLRHQPDSATTWDVSLEWYQADYPDIAGINRPTQQLIDDGVYITGQGRQPDGSLVPGAGAVISPTGAVVIPRNRVLAHPDDINTAQTSIWRSHFSHQFDEAISLRNISYYQHLSREEIAQNSFVEIIDSADTVQNRTELDVAFNDSQLTTVALDLRYNNVLGYSQFTTEADNPIDLTGSLNLRQIPLSPAQQARLVALRPGVLVSPGAQYDVNNDGSGDFNLSDTTDSVTWQTGLALQQQSQWHERLNTIIGYRVDRYDVTAKDALPPADVVAASDRHTAYLHSLQVNATFALTDTLNLYAAYGDSDATSNSMSGGTVLGAQNQIDPQNFATENTLYEVGIKYAPDAGISAALAVFEQTRSLRNRDGSNTGIVTQGLELEGFYQTDNVWVNASYSYLDARYDDSAAFQGTGQVADAFDASRPDLITGTAVGSPSFTAFAPSRQQVQGMAPQMVTLNGGWQVMPRWEVGSSLVYTKSFPLDFLQSVYIRDQFRWDLNSRIRVTDALALRLDVVNVTDEDNWQPVFEGGFFGATLVMPERPRHARATLEYTF